MPFKIKKVLMEVFLLLSLLFQTSLISAAVFQTIPEVVEKNWHSRHQIPSTFIGSSSNAHTLNFSGDSDSRQDVILQVLQDQGIHHLISVIPLSGRELSSKNHFLGLTTGSEPTAVGGLTVHDYVFKVNQYDICLSSLRTVESRQGGMHVFGVAPEVESVHDFTPDAWIKLPDALNAAKIALAGTTPGFDTFRLASARPCLFPIQGQLEPAWRMILRDRTAAFEFYVGTQGVIQGTNFGFDIAATIKAYDTNTNSGQLKNFSVNVNGRGNMVNDYFNTFDTYGNSPELSLSNQFVEGPTGLHFGEQSLFVHANQQLDFANANGYSWTGSKPITIQTHFDYNNASYFPSDGRSGPTIFIGTDSRFGLQNLETDNDVVSHEFGHHVIYSAVTNIDDQSTVVLHEGLADTLTMLRSQSDCIGPSVCSAGGTNCWKGGQCLRSATNNLTYQDAAYIKAFPHQRGQVVSGLFWDLRSSGKIPQGDLNQLAFGLINYLPSNATMPSLITAMLNADFSLFNKRYQPVILAAAAARGMGIDKLGISLTSIDGKVATPSPTSWPTTTDGQGTSGSGGGESNSGEGSGFLGLCSIGQRPGHSASTLLILLALSLPIVWSIMRVKNTKI